MPLAQLLPLHIQHPNPEYGLQEPSYAVFTDLRHYSAMQIGSSGPRSACFTGDSGLAAFVVLTGGAHTQRPIAVDPMTPHALVLAHDEIRRCVQAWHATEADSHGSSLLQDVQCIAAPLAGQFLRGRLAAFLSQFDAVERAYVFHVVSDAGDLLLALGLTCADDATLMRIRRALPLLGWSLDAQWTPTVLVSLSRQPALIPILDRVTTPVYEAATGA